ncbi:MULTISPECIES: hypothetical protein [unclassified Lysinibacillus]|uniref:hypothetical protein n=1 Tax=unclassified Lysinibacillus TaxID=2636778 RepID=UPI00232F9CA3|nr:hypothetical protein [Lysinibacillus sp. OF-1]WCH49153.1 hypothetical protein NV349_07150 [Lysinibacillus sp. OF-1]
MSKSFNKVNTNIDLSLLTIKTEKEPKKEMVTKINNSIVKMDTFDELDNRNITIKHAIQILNQQWRLNGLRPRTIDSYNYNFKRFVEVTKVEFLHEINNEKIYQYGNSFFFYLRFFSMTTFGRILLIHIKRRGKSHE